MAVPTVLNNTSVRLQSWEGESKKKILFKTWSDKRVYEAYKACHTMKTNSLIYIREEQMNL